MESSFFITVPLTDNVKVKPHMLCNEMSKNLQTYLEKKFEGRCSYHGYIRPSSIKILKYSAGIVQDVTLNGDVEYIVKYSADVCNPAVGSSVKAKVVNQNMFGILAECSIKNGSITRPVLEIIIAKVSSTNDPEVNVESVNVGDIINVEIVGKKFELDDTKITIVGKIISNKKNIVKIDLLDVENDDDDVVEDDDDDDTEEEEEGSTEAEEEEASDDESSDSFDKSEECDDDECEESDEDDTYSVGG
jgi:DNA-directed RNA polymerase subunit E'/Rpb7